MRLRKWSIGLLLLAVALSLLPGCPYESEVPLGKSSTAKIDEDLIGEWYDTKEGEKATLIIHQFNDHEFLIVSKEDGKIHPDMIRAFVTVVKGEKFLNVQEIKASSDTRGWYLVNYVISGDTLTARTIDDKLFTKPVTSSRALFRFVKKDLRNTDLYGDDAPMVLKRVRQ